MTRDEVLALPAGRALDALVAEKVMGCVVGPCDGRNFKDRAEHEKYRAVECSYGCHNHLRLEDYSTSIAWAWEVVEKLHNRLYLNHEHGGQWRAVFGGAGEYQWADTAPLAICRAALLAVQSEAR